MINKFFKLFAYISANHPKNANDYFYAMSLIENCIKDSKDELKKDCCVAVNSDNDNEIINTTQLLQDIKDVENAFSDIFQKLTLQPEQFTIFDDYYTSDDALDIEPDNYTWQTLNDNFESTKVNKLIFNNREYDVKNLCKALLKICEALYDIDNEKFIEMANSEIAYGSTVRYLSFTGGNKKYIKLCNAHIFLWTNTGSNQKIDFIKKMLDYFNLPYDTVKLSIRNDYSPKPRNITTNKSSEIKIGRYVKERMRILSDNQYCFSEANLTALTDKDLSHQLVGCTLPFLVSYSDMEQGKAERAKYWKDIFIFNGERYYITSLWAERMRESFNKWYRSLKT